MKKRIKISALLCGLLAVLMMLPFFASCKSKPSGNRGETTEKEPNLYQDDLGDFDFGNEEFHVLSVKSSVGTNTTFDVTLEESTDKVNKAIYDRNREIEDRFNMVFVAHTASYEGCYSTLQQEVMAPTVYYDLIMLINRNAYTAVLNNWIVPAEKLTYIDLSKPYYQQDINEMCKIGGKHFFAYSDESLYTFERAACLAFNADMIDDLGMDEPYTLVDENRWTVETCFEMIREATVINNDETETYGLYGHGSYLFSSFWLGAGQKLLEKSGDTLKFTVGSNDVIAKITDMMLEEMTQGRMGYSMSDSDCNEYFMKDHALFDSTVVGKIFLFKDLDNFKYGVVPYPKYTTEQPAYYSRVVDAWLHVVPTSCKDYDRASVILEALAAGSSKRVYPAYYEDQLYYRVMRDPRDINMLEIIRYNRVFDLGDATWSTTVRVPIQNMVFINKTANLATVCASIRKSVNDKIAEANELAKNVN